MTTISTVRGTLTRLEGQLSRLEADAVDVAEARLRLARMAAGLFSTLPKAKYPVRHRNHVISSKGVTLALLLDPDAEYATGATGDTVLEAVVVLLEHERDNGSESSS